MIPLKLTLENFKCYRAGAPVLHLEGVHLACLCGGNGHGKSSLLDAMTWALWGDDVHRPQEELVHLGQSDMRVELEFLAGGGYGAGQRYRVLRRYARARSGRAGATSLELHVAQGQDGSHWRSISGSSVRETQGHITRLVGMDYATFVNSAFLVQGRADAFTTQTPAERQRVLARVLDLERYERLQERARDKARERASLMLSLQGQLQAWAQQLAQKPGHEEEMPKVEAALAEAGAQVEASERALTALRDQTAALRERRREMEALERQSQSSHEELRHMISQQAQHQRRLAAWQALLARENNIAVAYSRLQELRQRDEALNKLVDPYGRLQERRGSVLQRAQALPRLKAALAAAQREMEGLSQREAGLDARRQELQGLEVERQGLASANERLMQDMQDLRKKVDMLAQGEAQCPLCGTELGVDGRQHIAAEYESQGKVLAQEHRRNQVRLRDVEPRCKEIEAWVRREERSVAEGRRGTLAKAGALSQQADDARKAPAELAQIEQELAALGYDPSLHRQVREAIGGLAGAEEEHRLLQEALRNLPEEREALARVEEMVARRRQATAQDAERIALLRQELAALPLAEGRLREADAACQEAQARHRQLLQRKGFLEERLREYAALERQKAEAETQLAATLEERQVYEELATAFGRTGVPALIIEAAIPQLQAYASELLGRMTDHMLSVKLETQRETRGGNVAETLEVKVSDGAWTRSYETFSGGEAFRINLALRIGLSKLLASRAGAPLPTLFIDEGFGTQDAAGRERILDVIQSIAEDFQCILVITHMDEVKDAFPVRIEVHKTEAGSTFAMV